MVTMEANRASIMNLGFAPNDQNQQHAQLDGDETTFNAAIDSMFGVVDHQAPTSPTHTHHHENKRRRLDHDAASEEENNAMVALNGNTFENDDNVNVGYQHQHQQHQQNKLPATIQQIHQAAEEQTQQTMLCEPMQPEQQQQQNILANSFMVQEGTTHLHTEQQQQQPQHLPPQPILPSLTLMHVAPLQGVTDSQLQQNQVPIQPIQAQPLVHVVARTQQPQPQNTWTTDHVSEARRRMNTLIQRQQQAQEELRTAEEALKRGQLRIEMAKKAIEVTNSSVHQGTEELTDALLQEPTHWNAMYRKLKGFKLQFGHVEVRRNLTTVKGGRGRVEGDPETLKLSTWIGRVRLEARRPAGHPDQIEPYKIIALNRLGFNWDPRENYWLERFEELKAHFAKEPNEKKKMPNRKTSLGVWCDGQVLEFNRFKSGAKPCYITKERIELLNSIGFLWDRMLAAWMSNYDALKKFHDDFGHNQVSVNYGDKTLFRWVAKQKKKYKNFKEGKKPALTEEQVKLLRDINLFESEKKYPVHHKHRRYRSSRNKGRPKSTTLIPQEAREVPVTDQTTIANRDNATAAVTPTTETATATTLAIQEISPLPVNEENFNEITHEIIDGGNISEHGPLNENHDPGEDRAPVDFEHDTKMPAIDTGDDVDISVSGTTLKRPYITQL